MKSKEEEETSSQRETNPPTIASLRRGFSPQSEGPPGVPLPLSEVAMIDVLTMKVRNLKAHVHPLLGLQERG